MVSLPVAYRVFRGFIAMVAMLWLLAIAPSLRGEEPPSYRWIKVTGQAPFAARDGAGALVFRGRMWLLGGWNPGDRAHFPRICNNEVWSSGDGRDWTLDQAQHVSRRPVRPRATGRAGTPRATPCSATGCGSSAAT